jgi:DHA1 family multidrug resistance protein-like MFS transporter
MLQWQRTLYTIWITEFLAIAGFAFVGPFIPYYIQDLGVSDPKQVALWAGLTQSSLSLTLAIMAPIWGVLADRHGRKVMVMRATFAGAVLMALMGFVANVQQIVLLRALQGVFTGTVAAATAMVAGIVPKQHSGAALGSLQTAIFLGSTLGPLAGGVMSDAFGYRPSFWVTGALLFLSGLLVLMFVREDFHPAHDVSASRRSDLRLAVRLVFASGGALIAVLAARILLRAGTQVITPTLPLFVQSLLPLESRVATVAGLVTGANAVGAAIGSPIIGRWGDRVGHRRLLIASGLAAVLLQLPQAFVQNTEWLMVWQLLGGLAIGGTLSTLTALLVQFSPKGHEGMVIGLDSSAVALAGGLGPMLGASIAAGLGLRSPFVLAAGVLGVETAVVAVWIKDGTQFGAQRESQHVAAVSLTERK